MTNAATETPEMAAACSMSSLSVEEIRAKKRVSFALLREARGTERVLMETMCAQTAYNSTDFSLEKRDIPRREGEGAVRAAGSFLERRMLL
jgi:hypothetical protein